MPYKIKSQGEEVLVFNGNGQEVARLDTHGAAVSYIRERYNHDASELVLADIALGQVRRAGIECFEEVCERAFLNFDKMIEHAEAVHTFDDIRMMVREVIREKYGRSGDYQAVPPVPSIWTWIEDLADDWVVFSVEESNDTKLLKASYSIVDNNVTLGEPVEVRRRTVYDAVNTGTGA